MEIILYRKIYGFFFFRKKLISSDIPLEESKFLLEIFVGIV